MKKRLFIGFLIVIIFGAFVFESTGQYTGHDLEKKQPPDPFPKPGPGDLAILQELKETNRLLMQQTDLIKEQNRLMKETLSKLESAAKPEPPNSD